MDHSRPTYREDHHEQVRMLVVVVPAVAPVGEAMVEAKAGLREMRLRSSMVEVKRRVLLAKNLQTLNGHCRLPRAATHCQRQLTSGVPWSEALVRCLSGASPRRTTDHCGALARRPVAPLRARVLEPHRQDQGLPR